jgi:hypothetical protein
VKEVVVCHVRVRRLLLPFGDRRMRGLGIICRLHRGMPPSFPFP